MIKWLKGYYTRKDSRLGFMKEDLKLNLIGVSVMLALYGIGKLVLDYIDKKKTEKRIVKSINKKLKAYVKEEVED